MKAGKLEQMINAERNGFNGSSKWIRLQRLAAMQGIELPEFSPYTDPQQENRDIEIPIEAAQKIVALDFAERATSDLRAMGEGMAKVSVNVPSNINVWQHTKGLSAMQTAAENLTNAAKLIAEKAAQ